MPIYSASYDLSSLDGTNGFTIFGVNFGDDVGTAVSFLGDIDGNGTSDIIIGAPSAQNGSAVATGAAYVVFGFCYPGGPDFYLSTLNGFSGFKIEGLSANDQFGFAVGGAADINGDGFMDIIVGAYGGDPVGETNAGETYVIFGGSNLTSPTFDLTTLDGSNGFRIDGINSGDWSGFAVSTAGDINGDGLDDIVIGANRADPNATNSGESYVVFGQTSFSQGAYNFSQLDGTNGFVLQGTGMNDRSGQSVTAVGDINGDGVDDIVVGAPYADFASRANAGAAYLVLGSTNGFAASIDLSSLDGSNGVRLEGPVAADLAGWDVAYGGDINGDGYDDIIVSATFADPNGARSGQTFVVFGGSSSIGASFDLGSLDGGNGFTINGVAMDDQSGFSVSGGVDVNGDCFDDIVIGAPFADPNGNSDSGSVYVVFGGSAGFAASVELSSLDGTNGFRIDGVAADDNSGGAVSGANNFGTGDFNDDFIGDILIGAPSADSDTGEVYVFYGQRNEILGTSAGETLSGTAEADEIDGDAGADTLNGLEGNDLLIGRTGDDILNPGGGEDIVLGGEDYDTVNLDFSIDDDFVTYFFGSDYGQLWFEGDCEALRFSQVEYINFTDATVLVVGWESFFQTIQDAVDAASDEDIILVAPGTYNESVEVIGKQIEIVGPNIDTEQGDPRGNEAIITGGVHFGAGSDGSGIAAVQINGGGSFTGFQPEVGVAVGADDIRLDRVWLTQANAGMGVGVQSTGNSGLQIEDSFIDAWQIGARLFDTVGTNIDATMVSGADFGLLLRDLDNGLISNSSFFNNGDGINLAVTVQNEDLRNKIEQSNSFSANTTDIRDRLDPATPPATFLGSHFGERVIGSNSGDTIYGAGGDDVLLGNGGNDILQGFNGIDQYFGGGGSDTIFFDADDGLVDGGAGVDVANAGQAPSGVALDGGAGSIELIWGSPFDDVLNTSLPYAIIIRSRDGNDVIFGHDAADRLDGGAGSDELNGGNGNDVLVIDSDDNVIHGGNGFDQVIVDAASGGVIFDLGSASIEQVTGGSGNDLFDTSTADAMIVWAAGGEDSLFGGIANDRLSGMDDNDTINGGGGNDIIIGGEGADMMEGGTGADRFRFDTDTESGVGIGNQDVIFDFATGVDTLDFRNTSFSSFGGMTSSFSSANELILDGSILKGTLDGSTTAFEVDMNTVTTLAGGDFLF